MGPTAREWLGAGLLALILVGLIIVLVAAGRIRREARRAGPVPGLTRAPAHGRDIGASAARRAGRSVVEPLQVPRAVHAVQVDEGEPLAPDNLEVVTRDRATPPRLVDAPARADLHRLAATGPADRDQAAGFVQLRFHVRGARAGGVSPGRLHAISGHGAPRPACLGQRRLGVGKDDPAHPPSP